MSCGMEAYTTLRHFARLSVTASAGFVAEYKRTARTPDEESTKAYSQNKLLGYSHLNTLIAIA